MKTHIETIRRLRAEARAAGQRSPREQAVFLLRKAGVEEPTEREINLMILCRRMNEAGTLQAIEEVQKDVKRWLEEHPEDDYAIGRNAEGMHKMRLALLALQEEQQESKVPPRG